MTVDKLSNSIIDDDIRRIIKEDLPWDDLSGSTVLVAGASGMIPSYVIYTLLGLNDTFNTGVKVIALVRNGLKARKIFGELLERGDLELLVHDVAEPLVSSDGNLTECLIQGPVDYIINGASPAKPKQHKSSPVNTIKTNLFGTANLLDLAAAKHSRCFLVMSSSEVYGTVDGIDSIKEDDYGRLDPLDPRSCYSEGKRAAETLCSSYQAQYGIRCLTPRFGHVYGPGLSIDDGRVQADFAANVYRNENIIMKSDGSSRRAYTYVGDAVSGLFYILLKGDPADGMAYNIADSDNVISIRQLAEAFISSRPDKDLQLIIDIPEGSSGLYNPAKFIGLNNDKIKALGWTPKVSLIEGVSRMVAHLEICGQ